MNLWHKNNARSQIYIPRIILRPQGVISATKAWSVKTWISPVPNIGSLVILWTILGQLRPNNNYQIRLRGCSTRTVKLSAWWVLLLNQQIGPNLDMFIVNAELGAVWCYSSHICHHPFCYEYPTLTKYCLYTISIFQGARTVSESTLKAVTRFSLFIHFIAAYFISLLNHPLIHRATPSRWCVWRTDGKPHPTVVAEKLAEKKCSALPKLNNLPQPIPTKGQIFSTATGMIISRIPINSRMRDWNAKPTCLVILYSENLQFFYITCFRMNCWWWTLCVNPRSTIRDRWPYLNQREHDRSGWGQRR